MQRDLPVEHRGKPCAVRDHQETTARSGDQIARQCEHVIGGCFVEIACRLVGKQQQRVAIGRALAIKPTFLLADEPTGNLDEATADDVIALTNDLVAQSGCGFLMVTHSARLAAMLDRHVTLHAGVIA